MHDMLIKIIEASKKSLENRKLEKPKEELITQIKGLPKARNFYGAFKKLGIIAEIKLASPTAGVISDETHISEIVKQYDLGGANAISVITEQDFFRGNLKFVEEVKQKTELPVLQKDFVVDDYQIYEARTIGADALLLIVKILEQQELEHFVEVCLKIGLEPVVEINDEKDLEKVLLTKTRIIAVNARDLDSFDVNTKKACDLIEKIPDHFLRLGFSGVNSKEEMELYSKAGARGVLIGTKLMKISNKKEFIKSLKNPNEDYLEAKLASSGAMDSRLRGNDGKGSI